jgi:hypothetical protein
MTAERTTDFENAPMTMGEPGFSAVSAPEALPEAQGQPEALPLAPIPTVSDGPADRRIRNPDGTFAVGNPGGPGNVNAQRASDIRAAFYEVATAAEVAELARALLEKAQRGNVQAAKLVLAYCLGDPVALDLVEKIERMESALVRSREARP